MSHGFRLDWRFWVDLSGVSSVCIVGDEGYFRFDPATETVAPLGDTLEERYDVIYIDRKLRRWERLPDIAERYGSHLRENGKLVCKPVYFDTRLRSAGDVAQRRRKRFPVSRLACSTVCAMGRSAFQRPPKTTSQIYVFPRDGSLWTCDDLPRLLKHLLDEGKSSWKVASCLLFFLRTGLARRCPGIWPFRYVVLSEA